MEIELKNVSYKEQLKNVNFKIEMQKINTIIGPTGSGKSIILQLICQLKAPTEGKVILSDSFKIGYVNQNVKEQFFCETVEKELEQSIENKNLSSEKKNKKVKDSLKMVNLDSSILNKDPLKLSHSEMRKLSLAKALIINPTVLVLDDLTSSFDYNSKFEFMKLLKLLKRRYGKTIIIATQDIEFVHQVSDKIIALSDGKIIAEGDKYSIYKKYDLLKLNHIPIPNIIEFEKMVYDMKKVKLGFRDEINDLVKDILRNAR
jgi:energy-coupling factor transporter ATP-binding protein EcfA2